MNEVLYNVSRELQHACAFVCDLHINPFAAVVLAGLIAAVMEQRRAARRAPPFNADHMGGAHKQR